MKAIRFHEQGGLEVLRYEDAPDPKPGTSEVLVRVRAAALNHVDLWARTAYPIAAFPHILGTDAAGEIVELGHGVEQLHIGDRVVVYPGLTCGHCDACLAGEESACVEFGIFGVKSDGAFAELAVVPAQNVLHLPTNVPFEVGAAFPVVYLTSWHALVTRAGLRAGETVLIHGAGSGTGTAAIQIAKLCGAKVIATSREARKLERAKELGADEVVNNQSADWPDQVRAITGGRGVELALDFIGPPTFGGSLACLAKRGRVVSFGATVGSDIAFDLRLLYSRQLSIIGSMLGNRAELALLLRLLSEGKLQPVIDRTFPLSQARQAEELLEKGDLFGKIVLIP